jgi:hypothetical protein
MEGNTHMALELVDRLGHELDSSRRQLTS